MPGVYCCNKPRAVAIRVPAVVVACVAAFAATAAGCSDGDSQSEARVTSPRSGTATQQHAETAARSQGQDGQVPTRVIGGPLIYRITDAPKPTETDLTAQIAYTLVFRLSRYRVKDDVAALMLSFGAYAVAGGTVSAYRLGPKRNACFAADVPRDSDQFDPAALRRVDAVRLGGGVRVDLRPNMPRRGLRAARGRLYVRHPTLRSGVFRLKDAAGRRELKRIGCSGLTS